MLRLWPYNTSDVCRQKDKSKTPNKKGSDLDVEEMVTLLLRIIVRGIKMEWYLQNCQRYQSRI